MTTQPEALLLAEVFETYAVDHQPDGWPAIRQETLNSAAAELRRLHAENEALRVALEQPGVEPVAKVIWPSASGLPSIEWLVKSSEISAEMLLFSAPKPAQQTSTCGRCVVFCQGGEGCHCGAPPLSQREREALVTDQLNRRAPKPAQQPGVEPVAYLYHDARTPKDAHPWLHSTMLVLAADRRPGLRGETPLYTAPQPAQQPDARTAAIQAGIVHR